MTPQPKNNKYDNFLEYLRQNEYKETVDCEVSICHNVVQYRDDSTMVASNNNIIVQKIFKKITPR